MTGPAPVVAPAARLYRDTITNPERWETWVPNTGDILICTPSKCGTTWTQTMLAMLVHGGPDLPMKLPVLSPWVDADLGVPASEVAAALAAQPGRRVVKTHTPADGFPVWQGVTVIAVYRNPLDVFFSSRKHAENRTNPHPDDPRRGAVSDAFRAYVLGAADSEFENLATLTAHYATTVLSGRLPDLKLFHYSDMVRDARRTVEAMAAAAGIEVEASVIDAVTRASDFGAMKARAADYAPVAGTGFWKSDEGFFESGSSGKWHGKLSEEELALYAERLKVLVPDVGVRDWLEGGSGKISVA